MIYVIATIELAEGKRDAYLQELNKVVPLVRSEAGCLEYGPTRDINTGIPIQETVGENIVTIIERWNDVDALKAHLDTSHMKAYFGAVADLVRRTSVRVMQPF